MSETNEERLENMSPIGADGNGNVLIKGEDWHWLGEQAGRFPESEKEVNGLYWRNEWLKSQEENERLRGALEGFSKAVEIYSGKPVEIAMKELIEIAEESK
ncbi:hypothetical protein [Sporosarcina sp. FSL K6-1508]|uniref:hypothetical protein n=1 Tax=Sporosarcina sp. FSL K6-1508 TaxID=2921553 RepID=UPI0030F94077